MDYNIGLGKQLLPLVVQVLKYCTCPQLRPNFQEPPRCSLWALKPHIRQMWLKALLVILYKVQTTDVPEILMCALIYVEWKKIISHHHVYLMKLYH